MVKIAHPIGLLPLLTVLIIGDSHLASCGGADVAAVPLRIGAVPHVFEAANDLTRQFTSDTGTSAVVVAMRNDDMSTACASGQIDLVMPLQVETIEQLARQDLVTTDSIACYAREALMLCQPEGTTVPFSRLEDLGRGAEVVRVVIPDPGRSEHGATAKRALELAGVYARVSSRLVIGQNVRDAVAQLESGKADVGILPAMRAMGEPLISHAIPDALAISTQFKLAVCAHARASSASRQFSQFLRSAKAATILAKHGFSPCDEHDSGGVAKSPQAERFNQ